jgi:hypothetical protein
MSLTRYSKLITVRIAERLISQPYATLPEPWQQTIRTRPRRRAVSRGVRRDELMAGKSSGWGRGTAALRDDECGRCVREFTGDSSGPDAAGCCDSAIAAERDQQVYRDFR